MGKISFRKDILGLTEEVKDRTDGNIPDDESPKEVAIIATKQQQQQMVATFNYFTELAKDKQQASDEAMNLWSGLLEVVAQAHSTEPNAESQVESAALDAAEL